MTEKQYSLVYYADKGGAFIKNNKTGTEWYHDSRASLLEIVNELNGLAEEKEICKQAYREIKEDAIKKAEENKELKEELRIYRSIANCRNCGHHDYDWFDDGDEFEVCRKGNDVTEGICEEWEEL